MALQLRSRGLEPVRLLAGGLEAWESGGFRLEAIGREMSVEGEARPESASE